MGAVAEDQGAVAAAEEAADVGGLAVTEDHGAVT